VLNYHNVWGMYFVGHGCYVYSICAYCGGGGVLWIPDIFRTVGFVLIGDLVVCVYPLLPVLLSVLKRYSEVFLD
jgi:hypothetical protein